MEKWKVIPGFEKYEVSNIGNVRSLITGKIKPQYKKPNGYLIVNLNHSKKCHVHRLVGFAFIPNTENKPQINHKDGNKENNCVENLEWSTNSENQLHGRRMGLIKDYDKSGKHNPKYRHGNSIRFNKQMSCEGCGNNFIAKFKRSRFCSKKCASKNNVAKMNQILSYRKAQMSL